MSENQNIPETENEKDADQASRDSMESDSTDPFSVFSGEEDRIQQLESELKEARERELRSQAELENFRKRVLRDVEQQLRFANLPFARDLLEVVDNLNRATTSAEAANANDPLLLGVKLVQHQLMQVFEKYHCKPINALGQVFDPNYHQAIAQNPSAEYDANHVMIEASQGYIMHDRVIRPSQVIVSSGPSQ